MQTDTRGAGEWEGWLGGLLCVVLVCLDTHLVCICLCVCVVVWCQQVQGSGGYGGTSQSAPLSTSHASHVPLKRMRGGGDQQPVRGERREAPPATMVGVGEEMHVSLMGRVGAGGRGGTVSKMIGIGIKGIPMRLPMGGGQGTLVATGTERGTERGVERGTERGTEGGRRIGIAVTTEMRRQGCK